MALSSYGNGGRGHSFPNKILRETLHPAKVPDGDVENNLVQTNAMFGEGSMSVLPAFSASVESHFDSATQEVSVIPIFIRRLRG